MKNKIKHIIFTLIILIFNYSCRKPRNGNYSFNTVFTETRIHCVASGTTSTCDTAVTSKTDSQPVKIAHSSSIVFNVNDMVWSKNGSRVTYYNVYNEHSSPGSSSNATVSYSGNIINKNLIEGTFTYNSTSNSGGSTAISYYQTGTFEIKK